jgi:hypothetical protein
LRAAFRFNGNTIARKIRADATQRVVFASSLPSIAMHGGVRRDNPSVWRGVTCGRSLDDVNIA